MVLKTKPDATALSVMDDPVTPAPYLDEPEKEPRPTVAQTVQATVQTSEAMLKAQQSAANAFVASPAVSPTTPPTTALVPTAAGVFGRHLDPVLKEMIDHVDFGVLPRIIGTQGSLLESQDEVDLGRTAVAQVLSVRNLFVLSPGDDSSEGKDRVRYSKDGVTVEGETCSADEYIEHLREEGYDDASKKHYLEVIGLLESADDLKAAAPYLDTPVLFSLSPESRKKFQRYLILAQLKAGKQGSLDGLDRVKFIAIKKAGDGRNWTEIETALA